MKVRLSRKNRKQQTGKFISSDLPQILVPHVKLVSQAFFISQFRYASGAGGR
jgi:hypothetical protein